MAPAAFAGSDLDDEMAMLEDTFQKSTVPHGEEVEVFAKYLDDCDLTRGTTTEKLAKVFKLVDSYSKYVNDRAQSLRERSRLAAAARAGSSPWRTGPSDDMDIDESAEQQGGPPTRPAELERWEQEAQTWDLLRRLLPLRYGEGPKPDRSKPHGPHWTDFMESVAGARENKAVLEWLQQSAASSRPDVDDMVMELQQNADRGDILAHGWLHTRTAIKMYKTHMHASGTVDPKTADATDSNLKTARLVTQLDPDVVTRQGRRLAPQDEYFERSIWLGCFELLRRGRSLTEIRDWCQDRTEAWRAVSISGLPLSLRAPSTVSEDPLQVILWRRMCGKLAREGGADDYERGVYAVLSGDRERVETVSSSWDDFVFAHYNSQLRAQYDQFLIRKIPSDQAASLNRLGAVDFPSVGGVQSARTLADKLEKRPSTAAEAAKPVKALHSSILCRTLLDFLDKQVDSLADDVTIGMTGKSPGRTTSSSPASLDAKFNWIRTICHILIVVAALDELTQTPSSIGSTTIRRRQTQDGVVAAYVGFLRRAGLDEMVALYCSKMTAETQYECLSRNLIHVGDRDLQGGLLRLVTQMGLNESVFLRTQPRLYLNDAEELVQDRPSKCPAIDRFHILSDGPPTLQQGRIIRPGVFGNGQKDLDAVEHADEDEFLIRSLEWMMLGGGLLRETLDYGVKIYKYFLKYGRLIAARSLVERVSCAEILIAKAGLSIPDEEDLTWWEDNFSATRLEALDSMGDGAHGPTNLTRSQLATLARPYFELECAVRALDCLETTAQLSQAKREGDPARERDVAKALSDNAKILKAIMKHLLNNWLRTPHQYQGEFALIRDAYLPEMIIGYASTLHTAGTTATRDFLLECMELAALIADEGSDVADLLVRVGRLKEVLESFASCSKALAIWTTDTKKGGQGPNSKKYRETGRSLELWAVRN